MCRWIAYIGKPVYMDTLVTRPAHSLVAQSLDSKMRYKADGSILATNGDGFGLGWYGAGDEPGLYKVSDPAWSNENIHEICSHTEARIFMAHIREATTGEVQRSNTHPFKHKNWLFQHNGYIGEFESICRDIRFDITPELYPMIKGNTDSEAIFFMMLTYGLDKNPKVAIEKTIKRIELACKENNIPVEVTLSIAFSDGDSLYISRYASGVEANSQYYSTHADCMREINNDFVQMSPDSVVIVSEPLDHSFEHWQEMPKSSFTTIKDGKINIEQLDL